jgi:hypothetical protein
MRKKYVVELSIEERRKLEAIRDKEQTKSYRRKRAQILLLADQAPGGPAWIDKDIAVAVGVNAQTVAVARQCLVEQGFDAALEPIKREKPPVAPKLTGDKEARIIALACSPPPEGHARWTLQLLADNLVELEIFDSISTTSIATVLKKTNLSLTRKYTGAFRLGKARIS